MLCKHIVFDLLVQIFSVRHDENRIKKRLSVLFHFHKLIGEPSDGMGFPGACAVLNQVPTADAIFAHVCQERFHAVKLMIARENLYLFSVLGFRHLRVMLDDF